MYLLQLVGQFVDLQDQILQRKLGCSLQEQIQLSLCGVGAAVKHLERLRYSAVEANDDSN